MTRPSVQISTTNLGPALRQHLDEMLPRLIALTGVVGVTLNGGLSRGYADHLSEVDITIYLTPATYADWRDGKSPIATGITILDGQLYDIKYVNHVDEQVRAWDDVTLWDASYAQILYDPDSIVHELYSEKLRQTPDPRQAEGLLMACWWSFELAAEAWIYRGDDLQGHHMLNQAVTSLAQALFVANQEYIPHEKWLFHMSRTLEWKPTDWESRLQTALSTGDLTMDSVRTRQGVIKQLWQEVDGHIRQAYYPNLPVHAMQKSTYDIKILVDRGEMTLAEWRAHTGSEFRNSDPFHPLVRLEGERIVLDREALRTIRPDSMYAWHYEVVRAIVDEKWNGNKLRPQ